MSDSEFMITAKSVLADPDYQSSFVAPLPPAPTEEPPQWLIDAIRTFIQWFADLFSGMESSGGVLDIIDSVGTGAKIILLLIAVVLIVLLAVAAFRWITARFPAGKDQADDKERGTGQPADGQPDLLAMARQLINSGDLDAAAACLFRAAIGAVLDVDERRRRRSETARRLVGDIAADNPSHSVLQRLVQLREAVHYAGRPPSREAFETAFDEVQTLIRDQPAT